MAGIDDASTNMNAMINLQANVIPIPVEESVLEQKQALANFVNASPDTSDSTYSYHSIKEEEREQEQEKHEWHDSAFEEFIRFNNSEN